MKRTCLLCILAVGLVMGAAHAETRRVPSSPYPTIQSAIDASQDGDIVMVSPGVYFQRINFMGKDITVTSTDPDDSRVVGYTVLNGEGQGSVVTFTRGETAAAVLAGFTITGGYGTINEELSSDTEIVYMGGGIYCNGSSPTITKNVIVRNEAPLEIAPNGRQVNLSFGGGIGAWNSSPTITHNTIRNNNAYIGAGVICYFGTLTFHNNMVFENSAYLGGGLIAFAGSIYNNTFARNDCDFGQTMPELGAGTGMGGNVYMVFDPELGLAYVFNNVIAEAPSGGGLFWEGDVSTGYIGFNNVWGNSPGEYGYIDYDTYATLYDGDGSMTGVEGNISEDPQFRASLSKDFHLTLDSPCVNAGDPDFAVPADQTDIDGEARIYAARIDMGADEYVGYVKPVAFAGRNVHVLDTSEMVMLDGSESFFYDPEDLRTYQWSQVSGPEVVLEDADSVTPAFMPIEMGEYVFELIVADSQYPSAPDQVLVYIGPNRAPVADAGANKAWQAPGQVSLDGTDSSDPDPVDWLRYTWTQIEGPSVVLENPDTATPTFTGEPDNVYVFDLVVSDGFEQSEPSRVQLVTVGASIDVRSFAVGSVDNRFVHYPDISGGRVVFATDPGNSLNWGIGYRDFQADQTETLFSGGFNTQPKISGDLVVWAGGVDLQTFDFAPVCASVYACNVAGGDVIALRSKSNTESYSHPTISGKRVVWVQHHNIDRTAADQWRDMPYDICGADITDLTNPVYFTIATEVGRRDPLPTGDIYEDYDDVVDIDGNLVVWEADGDIYAADISDLNAIRVLTVCNQEARQYDPSVSGSYVVWTDERHDKAAIYGADLSNLDAIEVFPVVKGPAACYQPTIDGSMVAYIRGDVSGGQVNMACITAQYGVLDVELAGTYYGLAPVLDGAGLIWINDATYGSAQGARVAFGYSIFDGAIENVTTGQHYDRIQHAISDAEAGAEIVVPAGVYHEELNFVGKAVTVRSTDPADPAVVAATVIQGDDYVVTFSEEETDASVLDGLTITGGARGINMSEAWPTIQRCTISGNSGPGVFLMNRSLPTFAQCQIVGNGGNGIEAWVASDRRTARPSTSKLQNCLVAGNGGGGIIGGKLSLSNCTVVENRKDGIACINPTITNSIIYFNDVDGTGAQVGDSGATVSYSDVQGGWSGEGNLDVDPAFVMAGQWSAGAWTVGDYHLQSQGRRWDEASGTWVSDTTTSPCIDAGDPAASLAEELPTVAGEPAVVNEQINMGAYGGTSHASLAPAAD